MDVAIRIFLGFFFFDFFLIFLFFGLELKVGDGVAERLALIRKQREEATKKREEERLGEGSRSSGSRYELEKFDGCGSWKRGNIRMLSS